MEAKNHRPRCPECDSAMGALSQRVGGRAIFQAYRDPADGALLYACKVHGRAAIRNGKITLEATRGR